MGDSLCGALGAGQLFGGAVHGVDVVVAVMEEIAHLFPRAGLFTAVIAPQSFVKGCKPLMGLPIRAVQFQKRTGKGRGVRRGQAQIGLRRDHVGKNRIRQRFAHVRHQAFAVASGQLGHVHAEFLRQRQHHGRADRAVVVFHLVQIGQRHTQLGCKILLRQIQPRAHFAQLGPGIEFLGGHEVPLQTAFVYLLTLQRLGCKSAVRSGFSTTGDLEPFQDISALA